MTDEHHEPIGAHGSLESLQKAGDYPHRGMSPDEPSLDLHIDREGHVVLTAEVMEQLQRIEDKLDSLLRK